jgi:formylglycine-generating enzyme required for sulfatase activity
MPNAGGGGGSAGATAGTGGGSTRAPHKPCATNLPGPSLVDVTISPSVGYCMDATLVTNGQYQAFLKATNDDVSGQSPECTQYVKTHVPTPTTSDTGPMGCGAAFKLWQPDTHPEWIFPCASWCDAAAYCKWAGKRLCGTLDGTDGTLKTNGAPSDYVDDPIRTELTHACSQGGKTLYHYGDTFDPSNGFHYGVDPAPTEANAKGTIAPFDQISGFNGEVSEWEAGCIPKGAGCNVKGGGYALNPAASAPTAVCNLHGIGNGYLQGSGFRCCTD